MCRYVDLTEQLVTSLLGFEQLRDGGDFVELTWEDHRLFLAELSAFHEADGVELPAPPQFPFANVRVVAPEVDD